MGNAKGLHQALVVVVLGALVALGAVTGSGCHQRDDATPPGASASTAALAVSASASASATVEATDSAPSGPTWAPAVWEQTREALLGPEPVRPKPGELQLPPLYPDCANRDARRIIKARYGEEYEARKRAKLADQRKELAKREKAFAPRLRAFKEKQRTLRRALAEGALLGERAKVRLASVVPPGGTAKVEEVPAAPPTVSAFEQALGTRQAATRPFDCEVIGVQRRPRPTNPRALQAGVKERTQLADVIACEDVQDGKKLRIVVEVPPGLVRAQVARDGETAIAKGYEKAPPILGARLKKLLDASTRKPTRSPLIGRRIRVTGVRKIAWYLHGSPAYEALKRRGLRRRLAQQTAGYRNVWYATFEASCPDEGLGCKVGDGIDTPKVEVVASSPKPDASRGPEAPSPAPRRPARQRATADSPAPAAAPDQGLGRWEAAAREALPEIATNDANPFTRWFYPTVVKGARVPERLVPPGQGTALKAPAVQATPVLNAFRKGLAARGGMGAFSCEVIDFGQEINPPPWPPLKAALKARGEEPGDEASMYNIACRGDEDTATGDLLLFVPTYATWSVLEASGDTGVVKGYEARRHAYFGPKLKANLLTLGVGSRLRISGATRLKRKPQWLSVHGHRLTGGARVGAVWVAHLGFYQCPAEGLGCPLQDGLSRPAVTVEKLVSCPIKGPEYQ